MKISSNEAIEILESNSDLSERIQDLVQGERIAQLRKFGIQDHDDLTWLAIATEEIGEIAKGIVNEKFIHSDYLTTDELMIEMVQLTAVLTSWLECKYRHQK